jgi:hypothetical protein
MESLSETQEYSSLLLLESEKFPLGEDDRFTTLFQLGLAAPSLAPSQFPAFRRPIFMPGVCKKNPRADRE